MNTLPIIEACWIICGVLFVLRMLACVGWRGSSTVERLERRQARLPQSRDMGSTPIPARPQSLDEIRARMQTARGQEKAALEDMALDIEANTIDEQGYADWLRSIGENDPDLWRG